MLYYGAHAIIDVGHAEGEGQLSDDGVWDVTGPDDGPGAGRRECGRCQCGRGVAVPHQVPGALL